jgi:hypothetical protein
LKSAEKVLRQHKQHGDGSQQVQIRREFWGKLGRQKENSRNPATSLPTRLGRRNVGYQFHFGISVPPDHNF